MILKMTNELNLDQINSIQNVKLINNYLRVKLLTNKSYSYKYSQMKPPFGLFMKTSMGPFGRLRDALEAFGIERESSRDRGPGPRTP